MRSFVLQALLFLIPGLMMAYSPQIRDIDITVNLSADGSARITEIWDVCVASGTEWYIVKDRLSDIRIENLEVSDENGFRFFNEGNWDTQRSITAKKGRCGIVRKADGVELCWGVGNYGDHTYTVSYTMTNLVKSLNDCDLIYHQFISEGLSSLPEHIRLVFKGPVALDSSSCRIWGFGFDGSIDFLASSVIAESNAKMRQGGSAIILMAMDKGIFSSPSILDMDFEDVWEDASRGSDYNDVQQDGFLWAELLNVIYTAFIALVFFILPFLMAVRGNRVTARQKRKVLGMKPSEVPWCRNVPFSGDILSADYVLTRLGEDKRQHAIASAFILRMLKQGQLLLGKDSRDRVEISFNPDADFSSLPESASQLYRMMLNAAGNDRILQDKEFSRWSRKNMDSVRRWVAQVKAESSERLSEKGYLSGGRFTEAGQAKAREVVGFKKFLEDFTLISERQSADVGLWQEYLIFGALFGIADKVSEELKDINPQIYEQVMMYDYDTMNTVLYMTRNLASSITNANILSQQRAASSAGRSIRMGGGGGYTSFGGGGGGFSGGGFGGGSR